MATREVAEVVHILLRTMTMIAGNWMLSVDYEGMKDEEEAEKLNKDPSLSHDRLTKVCQKQEYQTVEETVRTNVSMPVSLFDDYSSAGQIEIWISCWKSHSFIIRKGTLGSQVYRRPVSYGDDGGNDVTAFLQFHPNSDVPELKVSLHSIFQSVFFPRHHMCHVNLRATEGRMDTVELSADEHSGCLLSSRRTRRQPRPGLLHQ